MNRRWGNSKKKELFKQFGIEKIALSAEDDPTRQPGEVQKVGKGYLAGEKSLCPYYRNMLAVDFRAQGLGNGS